MSRIAEMYARAGALDPAPRPERVVVVADAVDELGEAGVRNVPIDHLVLGEGGLVRRQRGRIEVAAVAERRPVEATVEVERLRERRDRPAVARDGGRLHLLERRGAPEERVAEGREVVDAEVAEEVDVSGYQRTAGRPGLAIRDAAVGIR